MEVGLGIFLGPHPKSQLFDSGLWNLCYNTSL